jgi:FkbM family methyltransferase
MERKLIYDVGMNNGDDTAYYLHQGYRVLAVEADPTLVAEARERFAKAVRDGRLTLLNVGIAAEETVAQFWICEGKSVWNSFDHAVASRNGRTCHAIELPCQSLRQVFEQHGVPHYLKLSLHGHDHVCLADLIAEDAPSYLSLELARDEGQALDTLLQLAALGYEGFKIIDQTNQRQLRGQMDRVGPRLARRFFSLWRRLGLAGGSKGGDRTSRPAHGDWVFPVGSSGPFGEQTDGTWASFEQVAYDWQQFLSGRSSHGRPSLSLWHDLHARHRSVGAKGEGNVPHSKSRFTRLPS